MMKASLIQNIIAYLTHLNKFSKLALIKYFDKFAENIKNPEKLLVLT